MLIGVIHGKIITMKTKIFIISICLPLGNLLICNLLIAQSNITYDAGTTIDVSTGADICADAININGIYSGGGTLCGGPLPVTLSSFAASVSKNTVSLSWATETELNNSGFDVERKETGKASHWQKIGFIQGSGTTQERKNYSFEDKKIKTGNYKYRLKQIDYNGNYEYYNLESDVLIGVPKEFSLSQNYPNPSNPKSKIDYNLPFAGKVTIRVYDILGREVITVVNEFREAGYYIAEFDGTNIASGVYFYKLITESFVDTKKMALIK